LTRLPAAAASTHRLDGNARRVIDRAVSAKMTTARKLQLIGARSLMPTVKRRAEFGPSAHSNTISIYFRLSLFSDRLRCTQERSATKALTIASGHDAFHRLLLHFDIRYRSH